MRGRMWIGAVAAAVMVGMPQAADAVMGSETIMTRVDTNKDKTLSWSEVRVAAGNRYDLIKSRNGHVTMLQLGGRIVPADLKAISKPAAGVSSPVSKEEYLALAGVFFDRSDVKRKASDAPHAGTLNLEELSSADGKKLVGLLQ